MQSMVMYVCLLTVPRTWIRSHKIFHESMRASMYCSGDFLKPSVPLQVFITAIANVLMCTSHGSHFTRLSDSNCSTSGPDCEYQLTCSSFRDFMRLPALR